MIVVQLLKTTSIARNALSSLTGGFHFLLLALNNRWGDHERANSFAVQGSEA